MTPRLESRESEGGIPKYYHGGKAGLEVGDWLVPSPPHVSDGCPVCVARAEGRTYTVGEFRRWVQSVGGPQASHALEALGDADDSEPLDPPSAVDAVYVTTDYDYALWYAARSKGDLYIVAPRGELVPSPEDNFPSFTVPRARITSIISRKVRLRERERRRITRRWQEADASRALSLPSCAATPEERELSSQHNKNEDHQGKTEKSFASLTNQQQEPKLSRDATRGGAA